MNEVLENKIQSTTIFIFPAWTRKSASLVSLIFLVISLRGMPTCTQTNKHTNKRTAWFPRMNDLQNDKSHLDLLKEF